MMNQLKQHELSHTEYREQILKKIDHYFEVVLQNIDMQEKNKHTVAMERLIMLSHEFIKIGMLANNSRNFILGVDELLKTTDRYVFKQVYGEYKFPHIHSN